MHCPSGTGIQDIIKAVGHDILEREYSFIVGIKAYRINE